MIFLPYQLLKEVPTASWKKGNSQYDGGILPVFLHVIALVSICIFEILMGLITFDMISTGLITAEILSTESAIIFSYNEMKMMFAEYLGGVLMTLLPGVSLLITVLIYAGLLVELDDDLI